MLRSTWTLICSSKCTEHKALLRSFSSHVSSSAELIAKWQGLLSLPSAELPQQADNTAQDSKPLPTEHLKQLCRDAIHVYSTEGAATVVPDRVTGIFMAAYQQLQAPQHKLHFFKLLVTEFGVQREQLMVLLEQNTVMLGGHAVDEAVQLWLQRAPTNLSPASRQPQPAPPSQQQQPPCPSNADSGNTSSIGSTSSGDPQASGAVMYRLAERLSAAAQPLYLQLLLPVSQHREGIRFLVNMRADLLTLLKAVPASELGQQGVALRALDQDLRAALARWFSLGLLQLQRITWEHSPGQLLQRVQQTEAVHKMQHLEELQRRLQQSDRRVFAFMHPSLPGEPLVVLHTAIMDHIPSSMQAVLAQQQQPSQQQQAQLQQQLSEVPVDKPGTTSSNSSSSRGYDGSSGKGSGSGSSSGDGSSSTSTFAGASVACFYSISSGQKGLAGVDLGNFLIKKAAQLLLAEMPQLTTLVTLSPIPGFRAWLITKLRQAVQAATAADRPMEPENPFKASEIAVLLSLQQQQQQQTRHGNSSSENKHVTGAAHGNSSSSSSRAQQAAAAQALLALVQDNSWASLPLQQQEALQPVLLRLCAAYLLKERRRNFALDPVAHFHLRNGAQLWRINWRADCSIQGLSNSCGLMVNYMYDLGQVVANNQRYLLEHHIAASHDVQQLLS